MDQQTTSELLCACLSVETGAIADGRLAQLSTADWDSVIQLSGRHSVTPLLYQRLKTFGPDAHIPASVLQRLREIYLVSLARNMRLYHELGKVLAALRNDDIPVIVLKGARLAEIVYGNIGLRPMIDIDLLVRKNDLPSIVEKLTELGYTPLRPFMLEVECATHYHLPGFTKPGATPLEIHWAFTYKANPFKIEGDELWERAQLAAIAGVNVQVLSPEDMLLYLCLHAAYGHRFDIGLRAFCDISETLWYYRDEMDWEQIWLRARQWDVGKPVYLTLYLARELLGIVVPDEVWDALEPDDFNSRVVVEALGKIFADSEGAAPPLSRKFVQLWGTRRFQDKAAVFLKRVFPSKTIMARLYSIPPNSPRIYFYYLVRMKDLLVRYGRTAWRMLRRDRKMVTSVEREVTLEEWLVSADR